MITIIPTVLRYADNAAAFLGFLDRPFNADELIRLAHRETGLRDFGDTFHHPREDEAFRRLAQHCPDRELPLARLRQEHVVIAQAGEELRLLLERAVNGEVTPRSSIEVAAATYLVYYVNHIAGEEKDVLPLAAKELTPADWAAVREAAPERAEPPFGDATEPQYRELRRHVLAAGAAGA